MVGKGRGVTLGGVYEPHAPGVCLGLCGGSLGCSTPQGIPMVPDSVRWYRVVSDGFSWYIQG